MHALFPPLADQGIRYHIEVLQQFGVQLSSGKKEETHFILSPIAIKFEKNFCWRCYDIQLQWLGLKKMTTEAGMDVDREEHLSLTICGNAN